jgi:CheY-like chemotaxis protein
MSIEGRPHRGRKNTVATTEAKPTVLVVEDDFDARDSFVEVLEEEGYAVASAADGREAESYLRSNPLPDAMVLDLMMPRMDGWAVAALMRQGRLPRVPLVVVTAASDHWGYPAPPELVLKKPVDLHELLDAVQAIVRRSSAPTP